MNILEIKNLNISYKFCGKKISILKNANLSVKFCDYICVVGKNGAGKSSLIKAILGIIPIDNGKISFINLKRSDVSYVPQFNTGFANMPATVEEAIFTGAVRPGLAKYCTINKISDMTTHFLNKLKIPDLYKRKMMDLSGGQIKRVLIARALCSEPKILILDEPFANLDEETSDILYKMFDRLNAFNKITFVMVLHDTEKAKKVSTSIINVEKGKVCQVINKK